MTRMSTIMLAFALAPAVAAAQGSGETAKPKPITASANGRAMASAKADAHANGHFAAPKGWSADGSAKLEAMYQQADDDSVPREPIADRVAEGYAKGASETTILASAGRVHANLVESRKALVTAGRKPTRDETARGASAMEHGVTSAEIEAMARRTPNDRSLAVAFDVLGKLAARGVPVTHAITEVQGKLDARASDAALVSLVAKAGRKP